MGMINWYQLFATFSVSLCTFSCAMHYAWSSPAIPKLLNGTHSLQITSEEASWVSVMPLIGSILGGVITGPIIYHYGRLKPILFCAIPYSTAWLAIAFGRHIGILYAMRFVVGMADSISIISVPMYIGEIADAHIRGFLGTYCAVSVILGMLVSNCLGLYLSIYTSALVSIVFPLLMALLCIWLPESPHFLLTKERNSAAFKSLRKLKHLQPEVIQDEFQRLKIFIDEEINTRGKFLDIFRVKYYRQALFVLIMMRSFQQFTGFSAISLFTGTIFAQVEGSVTSKAWVILYYVLMLTMFVVASLIIDKTGRKPLLYISTVGVTLGLLCVGIYGFLEHRGILSTEKYGYLPITGLFFVITTFSIGLGPIPVLLLGELIPTSVKSYALCIVDISYCAVGTLMVHYFTWTNNTFGLGVPFVTFAVGAVLCVGFVAMFVPETKGKTLEEIHEWFKHNVHS